MNKQKVCLGWWLCLFFYFKKQFSIINLIKKQGKGKNMLKETDPWLIHLFWALIGSVIKSETEELLGLRSNTKFVVCLATGVVRSSLSADIKCNNFHNLFYYQCSNWIFAVQTLWKHRHRFLIKDCWVGQMSNDPGFVC